MVMLLPIIVGLCLLFGFFARTLAPPPWNRRLFIGLVGPAALVIVAGIGVAVYFYARCTASTLSESVSADGRLRFTIDSVDCGDPATRTYQVALQALDEDGKPLSQTLLRSLGRPAPVSVERTSDGTVVIALDDGSVRTLTLQGDDLTPDRTYSLVDGETPD